MGFILDMPLSLAVNSQLSSSLLQNTSKKGKDLVQDIYKYMYTRKLLKYEI